MSKFRLTIANGEWESNQELFQNLKTFIYGLMIPLALTIVSGFWYLLVSHDVNWNASQTILILHILGGLISSVILFPFFLLHQKEKKQKVIWLIMPWKLVKRSHETPHHFFQRMVGISVFLSLAVVYSTGFVIVFPGILFYFREPLLWEYGLSGTFGSIHLVSAIFSVMLLFIHMLWLQRHKLSVNRPIEDGMGAVK